MQQPSTQENDRFLRIWQITGDPKRGVEPIFPISRAAWWAGVAEGRFPAGILLTPKTRVWRASDIRDLVARISVSKLLLLPLLLLALSSGQPRAAFAQASPFNLNVFRAQSFTASGQTGATIQLNGLVVPSTVGSSYASGTVTLTGTAITTVSFQVMGSSDNGASYYALPVFSVASPSTPPVTTVTATASGLYQINLAGLTHIRLVTTGTFTATSVSLTLTGSPNASISRNNGGGVVNSFNTRTGAVMPQTGDYTAATVTGMAAGDFLISVMKPTLQAGLVVGQGIVTGANTVSFPLCNVTVASITPTASELYQFVAVQ